LAPGLDPRFLPGGGLRGGLGRGHLNVEGQVCIDLAAGVADDALVKAGVLRRRILGRYVGKKR
jgi:hypothetical protein